MLLTAPLFSFLLSAGDPAQEVFREVWSPYCQGVSLLECPSSQAQELRDEIRARMAQGEKPDDIISSLKARYGEKLRMEPQLEGRESLAYFLPYFGFIFAALGVILFWIFRRRKIVPTPVTKTRSEYEERIMKDVKERLE